MGDWWVDEEAVSRVRSSHSLPVSPSGPPLTRWSDHLRLSLSSSVHYSRHSPTTPFSLLCSSLWILSIGQSSNLMISPLCWVHSTNGPIKCILCACLFVCLTVIMAYDGDGDGTPCCFLRVRCSCMLELIYYIFRNIWGIQHHVGSFKLTMTEVFTSEKLADLMKQDLFATRELHFKHLPSHHWWILLSKNVSIPRAMNTKFPPIFQGKVAFAFHLPPGHLSGYLATSALIGTRKSMVLLII